MSFEYKPVFLEEYNQTLRDSVNAYYTHAMNDPNMSDEDALKSTGEMAEQYLDAVQEFQETQTFTTSEHPHAETPKAIPPCFTLGHEIFNSIAGI